HLLVEEEEEVVEGEKHTLLAEKGCGFVDVRAERLDLAMDALVDPVRSDMRFQPAGRRAAPAPRWETALDLLADEEIGSIRMALQELEAAVDAVVIGDGDEIHPASFRSPINRIRSGVAVPRPQKREMARVSRMVRMHVQVGPQQFRRLGHSGFSR